MNQKKERNGAIDIFRYVAALLVVALHVTAFVDIHPMMSYLFAQVLPRISVPFFFVVSGYYYASKLENGEARLWPYVKKLLVTYGVWSGIYYTLKFVLYGPMDICDILVSFFITGSEYHFWFFPSLVLSVSLTTLLYHIGLKKTLIPISVVIYLIGCLGHGYYKIGMQIPVLAVLYNTPGIKEIFNLLCPGFPFFICGYIVNKKELRMRNATKRKSVICCAIALFGFLCEIALLQILDFAIDISLTFGLYGFVFSLMLLLVNNPIPERSNLAHQCRVLANFTYYSHVLFISLYTLLDDNFLVGSISETPMAALVVFTSAFLGLLLSRCSGRITKLLIS